LTGHLTRFDIGVLHAAAVDTLAEWTTRLQDEAAGRFREGHRVS
jgi:hypothetical protein